MNEPILKDPNEFPDDDVLSRILGRTKKAWDAFMDHLKATHPEATAEWRYYKDGHNWLYKVTKKKKTICWVSVCHHMFRTAFYMGGNAEELIRTSKLQQEYIDQFLHGKRYGKIRAITVDVRKMSDLKATKLLLVIKDQLK
jgi:hypothetical protein